ncbi:hypothetical protein E2986_11662 [Frieseomelitta varia]|uniref:Uncharacterized protein n=1 Tax=Frieseomelitta varia TaxID=561572 RepID=A0A833SBH1_9HYME|nr:hypothetical protein E2986_11662 [Frieseomelitta varia]
MKFSVIVTRIRVAKRVAIISMSGSRCLASGRKIA